MERGKETIVAAVRDGRASVLQNLLVAGADPDGRDAQGRTALMWAAECNRPALAEILLEAGAQPDLGDPGSGITALWIAAHLGYWQVVRVLLEHGASHRETAFLLARKQGHRVVASEIAEFLDPERRMA